MTEISGFFRDLENGVAGPKLGLTFSNLSEILLSLSKPISRIIRNRDGTPAGQEDIDRR